MADSPCQESTAGFGQANEFQQTRLGAGRLGPNTSYCAMQVKYFANS
jgi:hypothetical protein